jgi:hypothetical protein
VSGVLSSQHIVIFTGAFGSGKTEVAINYARAAHREGRTVRLIDLDIVTPYFRVGDHRDLLQREGLMVLAAPGPLASFETPALSPGIPAALADHAACAVLDVGGDPEGARTLGAYEQQIAGAGYDMWLVVNPFRPATADPDATAAQAREIEAQSHLRFTGLAANPNLGPITQVQDVIAGLARVEETARRLGLPVVLLAVEQRLLPVEGGPDLPTLPLRLTLRLPWEAQSDRAGTG